MLIIDIVIIESLSLLVERTTNKLKLLDNIYAAQKGFIFTIA